MMRESMNDLICEKGIQTDKMRCIACQCHAIVKANVADRVMHERKSKLNGVEIMTLHRKQLEIV